MSMNLVTLLYLVASICFIQALKGLSHPTTSIRGNLFGMIGMTIAVLTTVGLIQGQAEHLHVSFGQGLAYVLVALVVSVTVVKLLREVAPVTLSAPPM
jgi:NAD(P) transhydrogenase subunit beta